MTCSAYPECGCFDDEARCGSDPAMCAHDYECVTDWEGDPDVINGTRTWHYKLCRKCGHQAPWDGRREEPDPDDARDSMVEDRELFGDSDA